MGRGKRGTEAVGGYNGGQRPGGRNRRGRRGRGEASPKNLVGIYRLNCGRRYHILSINRLDEKCKNYEEVSRIFFGTEKGKQGLRGRLGYFPGVLKKEVRSK